MEPTIYKPGAYNSQGIYKGAGGIYKGRGVYNDKPLLFVEIGGIKYPVVKIGNKYWTAENLDFTTNEIRIGSILGEYNNSEPIACYYNNDENIYKNLGLLYNYKCIEIIEDYFPEGWRVPIKEDLEALFQYVNNNAYNLKSTSWNGDNATGFNALPCGFNDDYEPPNGFGGLGSGFWFWSKTQYSSNKAYRGKLSDDNSVNITNAYFFNKFSLRLVKD